MSEHENPLVALSGAMSAAVEKAGAATVTVDARRRLPASGIAYASDLILTANHVVQRDDDLGVILPDGSRLSASVAGRDPASDLAVLRLSSSAAAVAETSKQTAVVGQFVLSLGRPSPDGIQASLGVVSALGGPLRTGRGGFLESYLRTDAIPYPGFSGGPLVDAAGTVVGLNTSGLTRGASIAIPIGLAWKVAGSLAEHGSIKRGYLGVRSQPVSLPDAGRQALGREQEAGLLLVGVERGSPAEAGGLMVGDILVAIAGNSIGDADELLSNLSGSIVGKETPIQVLRGGQAATVKVTIGERK